VSPEQKEALGAFLSKLLNPFTGVEELRDMFMKPVPPMCGQI
jgi:hypothetical protein